MPGTLRGPSTDGSRDSRAARLRERVDRLYTTAVKAHGELQAQFAGDGPASLQDRQVLAKRLQDERTALTVVPMRERVKALRAKADALAGPEDADDGLLDRLEAEADEYERQVVRLRAWFLTRAAFALGAADLGPASPVRQVLLRSAGLDPELVPASELLVRCNLFTKIGKAKEALANAAAAAVRPDADVRAFTAHAAALRLADRPVEAAIEFRRAYEASPDHDPDLLIDAARASLSAGCHQDALEAARRVLEASPDHIGGLELRADALRFLTRFEEAELAYRSLLSLPAAPDRRAAFLQVLAALGRTDEVEQILGAIRSDPSATPSKNAFACYFAHRYADAAAETLAALADPRLGPGPRSQLERLQVAFDLAIGCPDEALEGANAVLACAPNDADLEDTQAIALADLGGLEEAIASSRRSLELIYKSEYAGTLARALRWSGDASGALPFARRCQTARPRRSEGVVGLVCCLVQLGDVRQAQLVAASLPETATDPFVLYTRAALAEAAGDRDEAGRLLADAAAIRPELGLHSVIDPVFHDGAVLDHARRARLRSLIDANVLRRAGLAESAAARLDPGDALLIRTLGATAGLDGPREVSHWLYFADRGAADDAAAALRSDGYEVTVEPSAGGGERWLARAEHRIVVSPETIAATRASMERLATRLGGEYDGWEAAVEP